MYYGPAPILRDISPLELITRVGMVLLISLPKLDRMTLPLVLRIAVLLQFVWSSPCICELQCGHVNVPNRILCIINRERVKIHAINHICL